MTFDLSEEAAGTSLTATPAESIDYDVHDEGVALGWKAVGGRFPDYAR